MRPGSTAGPFYVMAGGCSGCQPLPDLASTDPVAYSRGWLLALAEIGRSHCRYYRQPETADDLDQAIDEVRICVVGAIRYAGTDKAVLDRIDRPESCDAMPIGGSE